MKVPSKLAGTWVKCPGCGAETSVPGKAATPEAEVSSLFDFKSPEVPPEPPIIQPVIMPVAVRPIARPVQHPRRKMSDWHIIAFIVVCVLVVVIVAAPSIREKFRSIAKANAERQREIENEEKKRKDELDKSVAELSKSIDDFSKELSGEGSRQPGEIVKFSNGALGFDSYWSLREYATFLRASDNVGMKKMEKQTRSIGGKSARIIRRVSGVGEDAIYEVRMTDSEELVHTVGLFIVGGK